MITVKRIIAIEGSETTWRPVSILLHLNVDIEIISKTNDIIRFALLTPIGSNVHMEIGQQIRKPFITFD